MLPLQQMQKRAAGEHIAPENILALHQNMKPVWVIFIVWLGWKIGMTSSLFCLMCENMIWSFWSPYFDATVYYKSISKLIDALKLERSEHLFSFTIP